MLGLKAPRSHCQRRHDHDAAGHDPPHHGHEPPHADYHRRAQQGHRCARTPSHTGPWLTLRPMGHFAPRARLEARCRRLQPALTAVPPSSRRQTLEHHVVPQRHWRRGPRLYNAARGALLETAEALCPRGPDAPPPSPCPTCHLPPRSRTWCCSSRSSRAQPSTLASFLW